MSISQLHDTLPRLAFACALILPAALAHAEDLALTIPFDSPDLEWGPCPEVFAEGCGIAVLHGDPAAPNADILFKYPAGATFAKHWHTSAERIYVIAGAMELSYEGQEPATVNPGDYAYGPAKRHHSGVCVSEEDCLLFIAFEAPIDVHLVEPDTEAH